MHQVILNKTPAPPPTFLICQQPRTSIQLKQQKYFFFSAVGGAGPGDDRGYLESDRSNWEI